MKKFLVTSVITLISLLGAHASADSNFHIYLCFGQSNMEGNAQWESIDEQYVDPRFQMLATTDFENPQRTLGNWYTANCPIVSPQGKLGMADYFGRTMVAAMPNNVKIGVVAVAIGGCNILMFDKDKYTEYAQNDDWSGYLARTYYGGNPYKRLIDMAKKAQEQGVIKGILLHQGCSNCGDPNWPTMVKKIYNDILTDLDLKAEDVPLFVGETERQDMGGGCSGHNTVVAQLPTVIPTAHIVSSDGIQGNGNDAWHFSAGGYRIFGKRYAYEVLRAMGKEPKMDSEYIPDNSLRPFLSIKNIEPVDDITIRPDVNKTIDIWGVFNDEHREKITSETVFTSNDFTLTGNSFTATETKKGTITATYTDFTGVKKSIDINVEVTEEGPNRELEVNNNTAGSNPWDKQLHAILSEPMTIGKDYVVKAKIKADNPGEVALWPIWTGSPNKDQWGNSTDLLYLDTYNVTSDYQEFTWEFNATYAMDKLQWAFGKIGGKVYFDEVSCHEKGNDKNLVLNGCFNSDDLSKWEVIGYAGQTMKIIETTVPTGLHTIMQNTGDNNTYTMSGCRVDDKHLRPGIYIKNRKKIIIR